MTLVAKAFCQKSEKKICIVLHSGFIPALRSTKVIEEAEYFMLSKAYYLATSICASDVPSSQDKNGGAVKVDLSASLVFQGTAEFTAISILPREVVLRIYRKGAALQNKVRPVQLRISYL